ncbi:FMN-dependent NADH-azoreductase [Bacillus massiliigorillae]|uniref:FMN-dependent NADH-azoreductase n=1 Tax=Bacillus massiliigorillae TaxID=1243664 RepID=UPI0003A2A214|nr:FMN-dependent NADH-azoreductase [Bacillus massiliigorillae]
MSKVLFIKANNRPLEQAVSVKLYHAFVDRYKEINPSHDITELDLFAENLPYYDNTMITAMYKLANGFELTAEEKQANDTQVKYLNQFLDAEKVVFAFPLWNKTIPAVLHTYIDYLNVAGKTFKYTAEGPVGLAPDKKVAILNARGADFSIEPAASEEMAVTLIEKTMLQFGIKDVTSVIVEGHNQYPDQAEVLISTGVAKAQKAAETF